MGLKTRKVYVNPNGKTLSFLPKEETAAKERVRKTPQRRSPEEAEAGRLSAERRRELETLDHEVEVTKRRATVATWKAKARNAELGILDDSTTNAETRGRHLEEVELKMREHEAAAKYAVEKVAQVRAEAIQIFQKLHMRKSEKCAQILELLNAYEVEESVLPIAIQELIEEETYVEEQ